MPNNDEIVNVLKALADKTRLQIVLFLSTGKEFSCSELVERFELSQPALSHHYNKLIQAGILNMRKEGTSHYLSINKEFLNRCGIDTEKLAN